MVQLIMVDTVDQHYNWKKISIQRNEERTLMTVGYGLGMLAVGIVAIGFAGAIVLYFINTTEKDDK